MIKIRRIANLQKWRLKASKRKIFGSKLGISREREAKYVEMR
jgi:hypothetical protein